MSALLKPERWVPVTTFLAVAILTVWLLNALGVGGDHRVGLAVALGALATGFALHRLDPQGPARAGEQA